MNVVSTTYLADGRKVEVVKYDDGFGLKEYDARWSLSREDRCSLHNAADEVSALIEEAAETWR